MRVVAAIVLLVVGTCGVASAQAHVHLESDPAGVWLHHRTGGARPLPWVATCAAPCDATLPLDVALGLSLDGRHLRAVVPSPLFGDGSVLHLRYEDHARTRMFGVVTLVVGALAGLGMIIGGLVGLFRTAGAVDPTAAAVGGIGVGVLTLGLVVGVALVTDGDRVAIDVSP